VEAAERSPQGGRWHTFNSSIIDMNESKRTFSKTIVYKPNNQRSKRNKQRTPTTSRGTAEGALKYRTPIMPVIYRHKLYYCENSFSVTGTSGALGNYYFSANGIYDPNVTGTGHQPMGFDQVMLFYEQYTVVASKITVNAASLGALPCKSAVFLNPDVGSFTVPSSLMENGLITPKIHGVNGSPNQIQSHLSCSIPAYFGRNRNARALVDDVTLSGTVSANPSEQVYYGIAVWDPFASTTVGIEVEVTIEYDTIFWEPRKLNPS